MQELNRYLNCYKKTSENDQQWVTILNTQGVTHRTRLSELQGRNIQIVNGCKTNTDINCKTHIQVNTHTHTRTDIDTHMVFYFMIPATYITL